MHPVRFFRELMRVRQWHLGENGLTLLTTPEMFVMHRNETNDACSLVFTRTMRLNQAILAMFVTPSELHVAPTIRVEFVPSLVPYVSTVVFESADNESRRLAATGGSTTASTSSQLDSEMLIPRAAKTYDLYGVGGDGHKTRPRCLRLPMVVDDKITSDNAAFDDRPHVGVIASDGGGADDRAIVSATRHQQRDIVLAPKSTTTNVPPLQPQSHNNGDVVSSSSSSSSSSGNAYDEPRVPVGVGAVRRPQRYRGNDIDNLTYTTPPPPPDEDDGDGGSIYLVSATTTTAPTEAIATESPAQKRRDDGAQTAQWPSSDDYDARMAGLVMSKAFQPSANALMSYDVATREE